MPRCPNNCDAPIEQIMLEVAPDEFADFRETYIQNRKGVADYDWTVDSGQLVEVFYVEQHAYDTYNYFKYRNHFESESKFSVEDVSDGVVHVEYEGVLLIWGECCLNCGGIDSEYVQNPKKSQIYDTSSGTWTCANLL